MLWMMMLLPVPPSRMSCPGAADQDVVAGAAEQGVVAGAADQDVVAVAAVGRELHRAGRQARGVHHVVAAQGVDDRAGRWASAPVMFTLAARPDDRDAARVAGDGDHVVAVGAVDDDGVGLRRRRRRCPGGAPGRCLTW